MDESKEVAVQTTLENFHNNLWSYYLPIPKDVGEIFIQGDNRRVICKVNGHEPLHAALMPHGEKEYTIYVRKELKLKWGLEEGEKVSVLLTKDHSEFGMPLPESFEILLAQDDEGRALFQSLTMGKQRSLIYIVTRVKNIDSQLAKGLAILHHLKESSGKLDFKRLNELIKDYNNRNKKGLL